MNRPGPKPKLHLLGPAAQDGRQQLSAAEQGEHVHQCEHKQYVVEHSEEICDMLADDSEFLDQLYASELFGPDDDADRCALLSFHRVAPDHEGYARVVVGSPHGGPVFLIRVGELSEKDAEGYRACLRKEHGDFCES